MNPLLVTCLMPTADRREFVPLARLEPLHDTLRIVDLCAPRRAPIKLIR